MPHESERIIGEIATELAQAKTLLRALKTGSCWCGVGIGNPMLKEHSEVCQKVREIYPDL